MGDHYVTHVVSWVTWVTHMTPCVTWDTLGHTGQHYKSCPMDFLCCIYALYAAYIQGYICSIYVGQHYKVAMSAYCHKSVPILILL